MGNVADEKVMRWIPVRDELPRYNKEVLVLADGQIYLGVRHHTDANGEHWFGPSVIHRDSNELCAVTHWMNLPEKPA